MNKNVIMFGMKKNEKVRKFGTKKVNNFVCNDFFI